ncbi:hypothetical protein AAVH_17369 [Aphelenchoides avenae]|nr:hypothetical protein AAVH_17369 [Aphelenchus avenae]
MLLFGPYAISRGVLARQSVVPGNSRVRSRDQTTCRSSRRVSFDTVLPASAKVMFNAIIALEALLDVVAFLTNAYFIILLQRNVFHINLRVILGGFSLTLAIIVLCRFPQLITIVQAESIWDAEKIGLFAVIHNAGMNVFAFVAVPLTVERVLATFLSRFYERRHRPWVGAGLWVILWVLAVAYATVSTSEFSAIGSSDTGVVRLHNEGRKQVMCVVYSTSLTTGVVSFLVFLALVRYNVSQYSGFQGPNKHTLAYRYQLAENVRTGKQLLPILVIVFAA